MIFFKHSISKHYKYLFSAIVITIVFLSFNISLNGNTGDKEMQISAFDSLAHSDDIDSIEFTEVIKDVYVDESEHNLIIDSGDFKSVAYSDTSAVLQLLEITKNFRWAIIISMPAEIEGRAETFYILIDIKNRENMNSWLETETGRYLDGNYMDFKLLDEKTILNFQGLDGEMYEIELK